MLLIVSVPTNKIYKIYMHIHLVLNEEQLIKLTAIVITAALAADA